MDAVKMQDWMIQSLTWVEMKDQAPAEQHVASQDAEVQIAVAQEELKKVELEYFVRQGKFQIPNYKAPELCGLTDGDP